MVLSLVRCRTLVRRNAAQTCVAAWRGALPVPQRRLRSTESGKDQDLSSEKLLKLWDDCMYLYVSWALYTYTG